MNDAELNQTLESLESVLTREFRALVALDGNAIEQTTAEKQELEALLRRATLPTSGAAQVKSALLRIKASAQVNQALMVHARACVQGALRIATGAFAEPPSYARTPSRTPPVRVNLKG